MAARRQADDAKRREQSGSSMVLRSTPNKQIQRLQQRKSHSPYPKGSPRTPVRRLAEEAKSTSRSQPTSPQSPGMRAISSILGFLSPFASAQVKSSAAFGDPEESILDESQQNTLALEDGTTQEAEQGEGEDEEMEEAASIYPPLPDSSIEDGRISSDSVVETKNKRLQEPPAESKMQMTSFAAPGQSTPSRTTYSSKPSTFGKQIIPPSSPVFTFGARSNLVGSSNPALPAYPRASAQTKITSPLAQNYDLLARFFAEKAEQEAKGRSGDSAVSLQSGEGEGEETGLTEIEVAGCLKLIEESLTQDRAGELDRLRTHAVEKSINAPITPTYIDTSRYSHGRVSRSPSLPLGAAAGEMSGTYGMQSRPSSSFLSPAYPRSDDAQINRSLASTFSSSSTSLKRRHRPLYLGPGQGASAASNLVKRNQQMQQQRRSLQSRPLSHSRSFAAPSWQREEADPDDRESSNSNVKRRRMEMDTTVSDNERNLQPTGASLTSSQSMPSFLSNPSPAKSDTSMRPDDIAASVSIPTAPIPIRTATADAMLSILSTGPSVPLRTNASGKLGAAGKENDPPLAPEVVNPYQTRSRMMKRNSAAPNSSSLAAKEKERLKEEREKKQKAIAESKKSKESTLEMIERTAPTQIKKGGLRRARGAEIDLGEASKRKRKEEEEKREKERKRTEEIEAASREEERRLQVEKEQKEKEEQREKRENAERERQRKTEEVKKRMEQLNSQSSNTSSAPSASSASSSDTSTNTLSTSVSQNARKSLTFGSTFAPKKPSPLSQADNMAPDSPSSSSEQSERETTKPFSFMKPVSNGFVLSPSSESKPTEAPIATPKVQTKDARQEALEAATSTLPKFDFTANVFTHADSSAVVHHSEARRMAQEKAVSELPSFDLISNGAKTQASASAAKIQSYPAKDGAKPAVPFSFASSATSSMASTPLTSATTSDAEGDSAAENTISEKSVSALLSGTGEGEEDEDCLHEVRSKVWNLKEGKWIDLGIGVFKIKKNKKDAKNRILIRNEGNGKVMVNFRLMEGFKPIKDKNVVSFLGFDAEGKPTNYRCKVKTNEMAEELHDILIREAKAK